MNINCRRIYGRIPRKYTVANDTSSVTVSTAASGNRARNRYLITICRRAARRQGDATNPLITYLVYRHVDLRKEYLAEIASFPATHGGIPSAARAAP